jgi:hypothetical protein
LDIAFATVTGALEVAAGLAGPDVALTAFTELAFAIFVSVAVIQIFL